MRKSYVVGVGLTNFFKPGKGPDYPELAREAATKAMNDCKVTIGDVDQAFVSYVYGESSCGQYIIYELGMTGMPIFNVHNMCASGGTAIYLAKEAVEHGSSECVIVIGFELMDRGSITSKHKDRAYPLDRHINLMRNTVGFDESFFFVHQLFSRAAEEHMEKYGTKVEHFAKIAQKNHRHGANNSHAQFQKAHSLQEILESPKVFGILNRFQCSPTSSGAASVIVASENFVRKHNLEKQAVEIVGMEMVSDFPATFNSKSCICLAGFNMIKIAAQRLFSKTNIKPEDVQVLELHDGFSVAELISYEALGLCEVGKAGEMIERGDNTYGGKYVINPSGGLIAKGHPLGATGVAQCVELCWQLRGEAGKRQVAGAKLALQQNIAIGGITIVALYRLGFSNLKK